MWIQEGNLLAACSFSLRKSSLASLGLNWASQTSLHSCWIQIHLLQQDWDPQTLTIVIITLTISNLNQIYSNLISWTFGGGSVQRLEACYPRGSIQDKNIVSKWKCFLPSLELKSWLSTKYTLKQHVKSFYKIPRVRNSVPDFDCFTNQVGKDRVKFSRYTECYFYGC